MRNGCSCRITGSASLGSIARSSPLRTSELEGSEPHSDCLICVLASHGFESNRSSRRQIRCETANIPLKAGDLGHLTVF